MYEHRYRESKLHGEPAFPFYVYTVGHSARTSSILPVHWHNELEILYQAKGHAVYRVEGREIALGRGDALIVHAGELHSGINPSGEEIRYHSIVFKSSWLSSMPPDRIHEEFLGPVQQGAIRFPSLLSEADERHRGLLTYIRRLLLSFEQQERGYEMSAKGLLLLLIADMYRLGLMEDSDISGKKPNNDETIKLVLDYMEQHAAGKLDLDQLAAVVSLSRSHFCTFFKAQTGMRPMEYLNYIRVNKAAGLLRTGGYNVLEAALDSGYQHVSYFSKWFKHYMHMTPSQYAAVYAAEL